MKMFRGWQLISRHVENKLSTSLSWKNENINTAGRQGRWRDVRRDVRRTRRNSLKTHRVLIFLKKENCPLNILRSNEMNEDNEHLKFNVISRWKCTAYTQQEMSDWNIELSDTNFDAIKTRWRSIKQHRAVHGFQRYHELSGSVLTKAIE